MKMTVTLVEGTVEKMWVKWLDESLGWPLGCWLVTFCFTTWALAMSVVSRGTCELYVLVCFSRGVLYANKG